MKHLFQEHVPDDIYPICLINDNGIRGSCETYKTRMAITETVRGPEKRLSLAEAAERFVQLYILHR